MFLVDVAAFLTGCALLCVGVYSFVLAFESVVATDNNKRHMPTDLFAALLLVGSVAMVVGGLFILKALT